MSYHLTSGWPQRDDDGAFVNPETNPDYIAWIAAGNSPLPAPKPTAAELKAEFISAVQSHIDAVAQSHGYDSGISLASYATDTHPPFAAEAAAFIPWRSSVWLYCYQEWSKVESGARLVGNIEDFIAELPNIAW